MDYAIGTKYMSQGKHKRLCTITDILKTYNSKGELVRTVYVSEHEFMGQTITDSSVLPITVKMGLLDN